ncbi:MAG: septation protein IspZ [Candidatus Binatia bacterium]
MIKVLAAALLFSYPVLVWLALQQASSRAVAAVMVAAVAAAAGAALFRSDELQLFLLRRFAVLGAFGLMAVAFNDPLALKLLPAVTHLWLLGTFAATLRQGPPFAEYFARRAHGGDLPGFLRSYTRNVTIVWCAFFATNAVVYAWLAVAAPLDTWAFYTGFGCYTLSFALIVGEYVFHKVHFRFYEDGWTDKIWRRLFPPERSERGRRSLAWQVSRRSGGAAGMSK